MKQRLHQVWLKAKERPVAAIALTACGAVAVFGVAFLCSHTPPWNLERLWERHAALKPAKVDDYIAYGLWVGSAAAVVIAVLLASTALLWTRPAQVRTVVLGRADDYPKRRFWLFVGIILIAAAALRAPRLDHSLWGDEAWAYSDLIGGRYTQNEDGSLKYRAHPWQMTFFWDKGLNNQFLYTVSGRACNEVWRKLTGAPPDRFSEAALRIPSFVAGLLSIAAGAALLRQLGYSRAGLALALLLCVNPWHLRYSAEARSYTMLILFLALALLALIKALETDRRRWWAGFALAQFAALYSWKAAIHPIAVINVTALAILLLKLKREARVPATRCLAAGGFALMAFTPLFAPSIPQIALNLEKSDTMKSTIGWDWFSHVWSQVLGAMDWVGATGPTPFQTIQRIAADSPLPVASFVIVVIPILVLLGFYRIARRSWGAAALLIAPLVGALLAIAHFTLNGTLILKWYVFYAMPVVMAGIALALTAWRPKGGHPLLAHLPLVGFLALYLALFGSHIRALIDYPLSDPRAADQLARSADDGFGTLDPSDHITVGLYRRAVAYDPRMIQKYGSEKKAIRDAETLQRVLRDADSSGKSVRFTVANIPFARSTHPDLFELLHDERYFTKLGAFPAIEPYIEIDVYGYRPGSLPASR